MATKHQDTKFKCGLCSASFSRKDSYKRHLKLHNWFVGDFQISKDSMAESLENLVSIDQEWSEGLMHEASKYIAEIVEKFSDLGDTAKFICDQGKA